MVDDKESERALPRVDLLLRNATVVDPAGLQEGVDIAVRNGHVHSVSPTGPVVVEPDETIDCHGAVVIPAFANIHHHFATGLLRGAPAPQNPARNQKERLERVIWPFERGLTHADVRTAVRAGLLEATLVGTSTIVDHHVSSNCIPGVLDVIAEEVEASGLRAILCYEVTDRDGSAVATAGLAESERFLASPRPVHARIAGMVGLHAMSTVGPETLKRAVALAERFGAGLHLHLAESPHDNKESVARYGGRAVGRLEAVGALISRTLAAHAIHLEEDEKRLLGERDVMVAHNPRSNASNGVGVTDLPMLATSGCTIGLGGDGFTQDMRADFSLVPLLQRLERRDPTAIPPRSVVDIGIQGSAEVLRRQAGWRVGFIAPGYLADVVMLQYTPAVPLEPHTVMWHLATGFPGAVTRGMWINGTPVLRDGALVRLDAEKIRYETEQRCSALWLRL